MPNTGPDEIHVAVGVILDAEGQVLIALRDPSRHQGNLWEFPGGKVEPGEGVREALARELLEEVHLEVLGCAPFLEVRHDYGDKRVFLDVWRVERFRGEAQGREGQPLRWVPLTELSRYAFPRANDVIVQKLTESRHLDQTV